MPYPTEGTIVVTSSVINISNYNNKLSPKLKIDLHLKIILSRNIT